MEHTVKPTAYFPFNFNNLDSRVLTVLVIGTPENIRNYMLTQYRFGFAPVDAWTQILPVPNCPGKFMSLLNRKMV